MDAKYESVVSAVIDALTSSVEEMARKVPQPILSRRDTGRVSYRYEEKSADQAIVLKMVRLLGALKSGKILTKQGLVLDAGAIHRIMDEVGSDIRFLAGPKITSTPAEARHDQYMKEFFQEEFNHADPLKSTQVRVRVSRKDIRSYLARAYAGEVSVSDSINVDKTIDGAMSGYVHGAAVHILDTYHIDRFEITANVLHPSYEIIDRRYAQYVHRAAMDICIGAMALGELVIFDKTNKMILKYFNDVGEIL